MNLPDSFYIALCMTILLVGAVYWVWTQIQYVQRKVNVLENIVYELKTLCSRPPDVGPIASTSYPPAPPSVLGEDEDLLHERLSNEIHASIEELNAEIKPMPEIPETVEKPESPPREIVDEPIFDMSRFVARVEEVVLPNTHDLSEKDIRDIAEISEVSEVADISDMSEVAEDLQPGGVGSGITPPSLQSSLDGMTIKELRRLAQQKGISGANEMKKKDIIAAIRAVPIESFLE